MKRYLTILLQMHFNFHFLPAYPFYKCHIWGLSCKQTTLKSSSVKVHTLKMQDIIFLPRCPSIQFLWALPLPSGSWSLSQLFSGEGGVLPWTSRQLIAVYRKTNNHPHSHSLPRPIWSSQFGSHSCLRTAEGNRSSEIQPLSLRIRVLTLAFFFIAEHSIQICLQNFCDVTIEARRPRPPIFTSETRLSYLCAPYLCAPKAADPVRLIHFNGLWQILSSCRLQHLLTNYLHTHSHTHTPAHSLPPGHRWVLWHQCREVSQEVLQAACAGVVTDYFYLPLCQKRWKIIWA